MKHNLLCLAGAGFCALALGACGGGGSSGSIPATTPTSIPSPSASTSKSIAAATGGTVTLALPSGNTINLIIPPHALAGDATVTLNGYASAPGLPSNATLLGAFSVDTGGVALYNRLSASETIASAPSTSTLRLSLWSPNRATSNDVDTATYANGSVINNDSAKYVGISTVSSQQPYAFYATSSAATPAPITLTVSAATPGPYAPGTAVAMTAGGSDANGNAYIYTPSFSVSAASLGAIASPSPGPNVNPLGATFVAGNSQMQGAIVVQDHRSAATGQLTVSVRQQQPTTGGDTYSYSGTYLQTDVRSLPSPMPTATTAATLTETIDVKNNQTFDGVAGLYDFSASLAENTSLKTSLSTTDTFEGMGVANGMQSLLEYGMNWADDNGDTLSYLYGTLASPTPIVLDQIPEIAGASWTNPATAVITENDSIDANGSAFYSQRTYNADGSYAETSTYPPGYFGQFSPSDHGQLTENSDGSGSYSLPLFNQLGDLVVSSPQPQGNGSYAITFSIYPDANPSPTETPEASGQVPAFYAPSPTLYRETDVDSGVKPIPASCNVPTSLGTSGNQLVQTISRLDTILGYTDAQTTTSYVVNGIGVVCINLHDVQTSYYDFNGDAVVFLAAAYQTTTIDQTLGLQTNGTNVIGSSSRARIASNSGLSRPYVNAARALFARRIEHARALRERAVMRGFVRFASKRAGGAH